jgi:hypothetical protein
MIKKIFILGWLRRHSSILLVALIMVPELLALTLAAIAQSLEPATATLGSHPVPELRNLNSKSTDKFSRVLVDQASTQPDPISSPYPVPWNWVWANQSQVSRNGHPVVRQYRSQSLISPDGQYVAYCQIQMQVQPDFSQSNISSTLLIENLKTGSLEKIKSSAHFAGDSFMAAGETDKPGIIAILIPVAWSKTSDHLLVRQFEALFGSDVASDYALVWDRDSNRVTSVAPTPVDYDTALLLGWSQSHPDQVLFHTSLLGDEVGSLWTVTLQGKAIAAPGDQPLIFGRRVNEGAGPQAYR